MSKAQKQAAALVALVFMAIPAVLIVVLAVISMTTEPLSQMFPGSFAMAVAADGGQSYSALKWLPVIVAAGLSFVIPKDRGDWRFYATVVLAVAAIVSSLYLYFSLNGADMAHRFWSYTDVPGMDTPDAISEQLQPMVLAFAAWFIGILAIQLGVKFWPGTDNGPEVQHEGI